MEEYHLKTPMSYEDIKNIRIGDLIYMDGKMVVCRDIAHRKVVEERIELPVSIKNCAIMHGGPIVQKRKDNTYEMIAVTSGTSMRMEKFEGEFIKKTGVRLIIGKGGMGSKTEKACKKYGALQVLFPAGNAVWAATHVNKIDDAKWTDLGMAEALWVCDVTNFGPLVVGIDTTGANLIENNKKIFSKRKNAVISEIQKQVHFII